MARLDRKTRRAGMTLIEILVVLAIITLLVSLSMAAFQRVRISEMVKTAESVVSKLQTGLDNQVKVVSDDVRRDAQNRTSDYERMYTYCDGDADRAAALLLYCRLKQKFPTPAEIGTASFALAGVTFPRPKAFDQLATMTGTTEEVSAAILYIALSQRTEQGNTFASDDATSGAQGEVTTNMTVKVYRDGWNNPIPFARFFEASDLPGNPTPDPFDPKSKLATWPNYDPAFPMPPNPAARLKRNVTEKALGYADNTLFDGKNKALVVYSAGKNKTYELSVTSPAIGGDDVLGYRLRSIGTKGAKQ